MSFQLRIRFTGICAMVRDAAALTATFVMPYAWGPRPILAEECPEPGDDPNEGRAADGAPLRRHRAFLRFETRHLAACSTAPPGLESVLYLNGGGLPGAHVTLHTDDDVPELSYGSLIGLAQLGIIAPAHSNIDPSLLASVPPTDRVAARFLIENMGRVTAEAGGIDWAFPRTLDGEDPIESHLASEIRVDLPGLDLVMVRIQYFGGNQLDLPLRADPDEILDLHVCHLCDDNPLQWPTTISYMNAPPDGDFRWYFEMIDPAQKSDLSTPLQSALPLPLPHPVRGSSNAQGVNCFPAELKPPV